MPNLQEICKSITTQLEQLEFLEEIRAKTGRLEKDNLHYRALFTFKFLNRKKLLLYEFSNK